MPHDDRAIAISATFTAEAIQPGLEFWARELGLEYEIEFAGYNQLFQQLLDPAGLFASNRGGINVALARFEDWLAAGVDEQARRATRARLTDRGLAVRAAILGHRQAVLREIVATLSDPERLDLADGLAAIASELDRFA